MIKCSQCKFWELDKVEVADSHLGSCDCEKFYIGYSFKIKEIANDGVIVEGDEGWGFFTGPDFGCIHGVEKD